MNDTYIFFVLINEVIVFGQQPDGSVYREKDFPSLNDFISSNNDNKTWKNASYGLVFSVVYTKNERARALQNMRRNGFEDVRELDFDQYLIEMVGAHRQAIVMMSDGDDLFMSLYDITTRQRIDVKRVAGAGRDPRVKVLAENIWQQLIEDASYLDKDKGLPVVAKVAARFIKSGKPEESGTVSLEGEEHDYFITKHDANIDNSIDFGGASVLTSLRTFSENNNVQKSDCVLFLSFGLGGNPYFENLLNGTFPDTTIVDKDLRESIITDMFDNINNKSNNSGINIIADELPAGNIHATAKEDCIKFKIDFPQDITRIDVFRDGKPIRTLTDPEFTDSDLERAHEYLYTFVLVNVGNDGSVSKSRGINIKFTTTDVVLKAPPTLKLEDSDKSEEIFWDNPDNDNVNVFVSSKPFPYHANDKIDMAQFPYKAVRTLDNKFVIAKDFCGERYFLPVTIVDNTGIAGEQKVISSSIPPSSARIDSTTGGHVKVIWTWEGLQAVRIRWQTENGDNDWRDVNKDDSPTPEFELPLSPKARNVSVAVSSIFTNASGETVESRSINLKVSLKPVRVDFLEVKKPSLFKRNKYTIVLRAESQPPCDLYVLIEEGRVPLNITDFKSYLTIPHTELASPTEKAFTLEYHRNNKSVPLYFRIIAANRALPVIITPETKSV